MSIEKAFREIERQVARDMMLIAAVAFAAGAGVAILLGALL